MTHRPRILLVDDEAAIQRAVGPLLRSRGYEVDVAATGADALDRFAQAPPDLIVLDLGLPDLEGTEVCRRVRATSDVPIIVLSARGGEADKVNALDVGADDYVTKPFGPEELLARIRVALRRVASDDSPETGLLRAGALTIDYDRRRVVRDETEIRLTPKEFELLSLLARNHDRVLTHRVILKEVWGPNAVEQPEHLWTLIAQLRKKIEPDPAHPEVSAQRAVGRLSVRDRGIVRRSALPTRRTSSRRGKFVLREGFLEGAQPILALGGDCPLAAERQREGAHVAVAARQRDDLLVRGQEAIQCGALPPCRSGPAFSSWRACRAASAKEAICASMRVIAASSDSAMCGACSTWISRTAVRARAAIASAQHEPVAALNRAPARAPSGTPRPPPALARMTDAVPSGSCSRRPAAGSRRPAGGTPRSAR